MIFKRKGDKASYSFVDAGCIGRTCWAPGMFQHRSPLSGGGSRNTGSPDSPCCLNRAYRGCPDGPVGEQMEACTLCDSVGKVNGASCPWCGGSKAIKHVGLPVVSADLMRERKAAGWRKA